MKAMLGMMMPDSIAGKKRYDNYGDQMILWTWKEVLRLWPTRPPKFKRGTNIMGEIEDEST